MSRLVFELKEPPPERCNLSSLIPERLAGQVLRAVERIEIQTTRRTLRVGDVFRISPTEADEIRFEGGSERFDYFGMGMSAGRIVVTGDLGQQAGRAMRGGEISVSGNVGRLAGSGMAGGRIEVGGDAGDLVGAPLPGEATGMRGGIVHIRGNAGARAGDRMRRGLIAIGGDAGANLASRMIGGTVIAFGAAGVRPGYLMQRGTVIVGGGAEEITPTFVDSGVHELVAMRLLARWLIDEKIEGGSLLASKPRRLVGDTAVLGMGELFVLA
jgi:formylmethanofuran dehydrogenase subunit C